MAEIHIITNRIGFRAALVADSTLSQKSNIKSLILLSSPNVRETTFYVTLLGTTTLAELEELKTFAKDVDNLGNQLLANANFQ